MIKKILIGLVSFVALLLMIALFVKKDYNVVREIVINKPSGEIFNYIKYLKNQDHYSKWNQMDPNMTKIYMGTDGNVGFQYAWESKADSVGKGRQTITRIIEGKGMETDIHFIEPFEGKATSMLAAESISPVQSKVTWDFKSRMKYPMNLMLLFMNMDDMIGGDLETGLQNLKIQMEK